MSNVIRLHFLDFAFEAAHEHRYIANHERKFAFAIHIVNKKLT